MSPDILMGLAIEAAWKYQGLTYPNPAVGCVVSGMQGEILSIAAHRKAGEAHAEVLALKAAYRQLTGDKRIDDISDSTLLHTFLRKNHNGCFASCTLYVTLEPCSHQGKTPSCALLIKDLGIRQVVIAHADTNEEASGGAQLLMNVNVNVVKGVLQKEAAALLYPFLKWRQGQFVFFKWAQRLDGTIDGGTISSKSSRKMVHAMRDVCDLLVIGGHTVRCDRPTLDARMVDGRAPDVLIITRETELDRTIPLFDVPGRKVIISENLEPMKAYKNVIIEGGPGLFSLTKYAVDYYLCFVAPKSGGTIPFVKEKADFTILHSSRSGEDILMWLKEQNSG